MKIKLSVFIDLLRQHLQIRYQDDNQIQITMGSNSTFKTNKKN